MRHLNGPKILCIGACHMDYKLIAKNHILEKTSNPITSMANPGGVVRNIAENLSRLNMDVSLMSIVGHDVTGDTLITSMSQWMNIDLLQQVQNEQTGQYFAVLDPKGDMVVAYANMNIYLKMNHQWIHQKIDIIKTYDYIIADMNIQKDGLKALIDLSKKENIPLIIVAVSEPKMSHLPFDLDGLTLLICNQGESNTYLKERFEKEDVKMNLWQQTKLHQLLITKGDQPITYLNQHEIKHIDVPKLDPDQIADVTGAGDAFSAGVVFGLTQNLSIEEAIHAGIINAKHTIYSKDSVNQNLSEEAFLKEVKNAKL